MNRRTDITAEQARVKWPEGSYELAADVKGPTPDKRFMSSTEVTLKLSVGTSEFEAVWTALTQFVDNEGELEPAEQSEFLSTAVKLREKLDAAFASLAESKPGEEMVR